MSVFLRFVKSCKINMTEFEERCLIAGVLALAYEHLLFTLMSQCYLGTRCIFCIIQVTFIYFIIL